MRDVHPIVGWPKSEAIMKPLEVAEIQGIVLRGYAELSCGSYLILSFPEHSHPKRWLLDILPLVTFADQKPATRALQVALTLTGFARLGLTDEDLKSFSLEFQGGMTLPWRSRILGDDGPSEPANWLWGGPNNPPTAAVLLTYASGSEELAEFEQQLRETAARHGVVVTLRLPTLCLQDAKEHFGFRDGISQPRLRGYHDSDGPNNLVSPGEFLLGYENEYDEWPQSPSVAAAVDALPRHPEQPGRGNLGANGSYMVLRQLEQDVHAFWSFAKGQSGAASSDDAILLAAKMVGRWPSGAPMTLAPTSDQPEMLTNDFDYSGDQEGLACCIGSHVRRVNPRGAVRPAPGNSSALRQARRHRLLRRGRSYGQPLSASMSPDELMNAPKDDNPRGLHFVCFVANIRRQFEFIQQAWMNNPKFNGLYGDPDPISSHQAGDDRCFTIQAEPVRRRVRGVPRFVQARGGGYFFLPGRRALTWLAH
jgi:Dyp-type peroxidase family